MKVIVIEEILAKIIERREIVRDDRDRDSNLTFNYEKLLDFLSNDYFYRVS